MMKRRRVIKNVSVRDRLDRGSVRPFEEGGQMKLGAVSRHLCAGHGLVASDDCEECGESTASVVRGLRSNETCEAS